MSTEITRKRPRFLFRAVLMFVLLGAILVGIYVAAYRSHPVVAEWGDPNKPGSHEVFVYDGAVYRLIGVLGKNGLTESKHPIGEIIGRVNDDTLAETEAPTVSPNADPDETVKVTPPDGDPTLVRDHAYLLYTIKKSGHENILLLLEKDGQHYVYYREVAVWEDPAALTTFIYNGETYHRAGTVGSVGLSSRDYENGDVLGLIRNDHHLIEETLPETLPETEGETIPGIHPDKISPDYAGQIYVMYTVKQHSGLIAVEEVNGKTGLYYREGDPNPADRS